MALAASRMSESPNRDLPDIASTWWSSAQAMGPAAAEASWAATVSPSRVTLIWPEGMAMTWTSLPMQARGTDHCLPAARTSMVAGALCTLTSPTMSRRRRMLPMGRRCSFSLMNGTAGGSPVVSSGSGFERASILAMASIRPRSPSKSWS